MSLKNDPDVIALVDKGVAKALKQQQKDLVTAAKNAAADAAQYEDSGEAKIAKAVGKAIVAAVKSFGQDESDKG
jgi:hypothetical protein